MDRTAVCSQCGGLAKPPRTCNMCGMLVCGKCFEGNLGLCKLCAAKARRRPY